MRDLLLAMTVALAGVPHANAQDVSDPGTKPVADQDIKGIEDIVVTAQRRRETLQRSSLSIQVLGAAALERSAPMRAQDLNVPVPGIQIASVGANTQISIRGISDNSSNPLGNPSVSFNVDGVYVGRATSISTNFYDVARVEVFKGPRGTLYGRNASGGAVNLITLAPQPGADTWRLEFEVGNYALKRVFGGFDKALGDTLALRAAFQDIDRDGYLSDRTSDSRSLAGRVRLLWQPGNTVSLMRIMETDTATIPPFGMVRTTSEEVRRHPSPMPRYATPEGLLRVHVQTFVLEVAGRRILIDPCVGNDKPRSAGPPFHMPKTDFLGNLARAGFAPDTIDTVLCTHVHLDHVGWNTRLVDGHWVPTFPNARYLFGRVELAFAEEELEDNGQIYADSIRPIMDAGLADLFEADQVIAPGVTLRASPGPTPGHCSIEIVSRDKVAVITGDMIHHALQAAMPDICSNFCHDEDGARATRRRQLDQWAQNGTIVIGTHFADPVAVAVERVKAGWRFRAIDDL